MSIFKNLIASPKKEEKENQKPVVKWQKTEEILAKQKEQKAARITPERITILDDNEIFVFGTDAEGTHSYGASRFAAKNFGAVEGRREGIQGHSYAIPSDLIEPKDIKPYIDRFVAFAKRYPNKTFLVTPIGCGASGYTPKEIAPLFAEAAELKNVCLPESFWECLNQ